MFGGLEHRAILGLDVQFGTLLWLGQALEYRDKRAPPAAFVLAYDGTGEGNHIIRLLEAKEFNLMTFLEHVCLVL